MGRTKLTKDQLKQRVYDRSLKTCEYLSGEVGGELTLRCLIHNEVFTTNYENIKRKDKAHHLCPKCQKEDIEERYKDGSTLTTCAFCGKEFRVRNHRFNSSKSGLHFCCRECKDNAQKLDSGDLFKDIRPHDNATGVYSYRTRAFEAYPHKCSVCGWEEDEDVLEVHHIDSNRSNNDLTNLVILCPTCHKKITIHKYQLSSDRTTLNKI